MKFLLYEIIPRAGFNLATGRFWPAGRMFDTLLKPKQKAQDFSSYVPAAHKRNCSTAQ